MPSDRVDGNLPALDRVATLAVRSKLPVVHIGVAIGAMGAHLLEHQARMALRALHLFMHSAQGITGLVMIEFRMSADWLPAGVGMAVLARNRERAVRVGHLGLRSAYLRMRGVCSLLRHSSPNQGE